MGIRSVVSTFSSGKVVSISIAENYNEALQRVASAEFDIVILDMTLKNYRHSGIDDSFPFGGEFIIDELDRTGSRARVIVVTQFDTFEEHDRIITVDDLSLRLSSKYPAIFCGTVMYRSESTEWERSLLDFLQER